jgi:hypothetical protein
MRLSEKINLKKWVREFEAKLQRRIYEVGLGIQAKVLNGLSKKLMCLMYAVIEHNTRNRKFYFMYCDFFLTFTKLLSLSCFSLEYWGTLYLPRIARLQNYIIIPLQIN